MNTISIDVKVKNNLKNVKIVLCNKIYLTPGGIVSHWFSNNNCEYRLEIIIDESDLSINPSKIAKDMNIVTDEREIADQIMLKLHKKGVLQM